MRVASKPSAGIPRHAPSTPKTRRYLRYTAGTPRPVANTIQTECVYAARIPKIRCGYPQTVADTPQDTLRALSRPIVGSPHRRTGGISCLAWFWASRSVFWGCHQHSWKAPAACSKSIRTVSRGYSRRVLRVPVVYLKGARSVFRKYSQHVWWVLQHVSVGPRICFLEILAAWEFPQSISVDSASWGEGWGLGCSQEFWAGL